MEKDTMTDPTNGMRVTVDGTTHPIHDNVPSMSATLVYATGEIAEVQIALHKGTLVVIAAGDVEFSRTPRENFARLQVFPTPKVPA
jgi:hypothetical protein